MFDVSETRAFCGGPWFLRGVTVAAVPRGSVRGWFSRRVAARLLMSVLRSRVWLVLIGFWRVRAVMALTSAGVVLSLVRRAGARSFRLSSARLAGVVLLVRGALAAGLGIRLRSPGLGIGGRVATRVLGVHFHGSTCEKCAGMAGAISRPDCEQ
ncbi:MAG: hypothetical protein R3B07_14190 [Polyangiaceae bacterium]